MKPTIAQAEALAAMRSGALLWEMYGFPPSIGSQMVIHRNTFKSLVARGYVVFSAGHPSGGELYRLTDAGRAALAAVRGDGEGAS